MLCCHLGGGAITISAAPPLRGSMLYTSLTQKLDFGKIFQAASAPRRIPWPINYRYFNEAHCKMLIALALHRALGSVVVVTIYIARSRSWVRVFRRKSISYETNRPKARERACESWRKWTSRKKKAEKWECWMDLDVR